MLEQVNPQDVRKATIEHIQTAITADDKPALRQWRALDNAARDALHTRECLVVQMRYLAADLTRTAAHLENEVTQLPNSRGEMQGRGTEIDCLCRELSVRHKLLQAVTPEAWPADGD